jgi:hypothetical protein
MVVSFGGRIILYFKEIAPDRLVNLGVVKAKGLV